MITKLTPAQAAFLPIIRDEWLAHGLSTHPANQAAAEAGIRAAYTAAGLPPPRFLIWLGSPWAGVIGQAIAPAIIAEITGGQVRGQVYGQVDGQVRGQVHGQVHGQVYGQVYGQVRGQVYGQVRGQVHDQVHGQVHDQVHGQVHGQVHDQVHGQVHGQVRGQVRGQVHGQVHDQVHGQVYGQVRGQVYGQVRDQVHDQVYDQVQQSLLNWYQGCMYGQHWAGYLSFYDAMERIGVTGLEPIHGQQQAARSAGWWWAFSGFAIATERPCTLRRDADHALHSASGPAIAYPDGWGFWCWHGRRVPEWVIERPSVVMIAKETNVEIRRCAIEALGWGRFVEDAGLTPVGTTPGTRRRSTELCTARVPDPGNPGQSLTLYDVPERLWGDRVRLLMCTNGSTERDGTRRRYGLTVPAHINDPVEAAAWTAGLTAPEYARMQRRT